MVDYKAYQQDDNGINGNSQVELKEQRPQTHARARIAPASEDELIIVTNHENTTFFVSDMCMILICSIYLVVIITLYKYKYNSNLSNISILEIIIILIISWYSHYEFINEGTETISAIVSIILSIMLLVSFCFFLFYPYGKKKSIHYVFISYSINLSVIYAIFRRNRKKNYLEVLKRVTRYQESHIQNV